MMADLEFNVVKNGFFVPRGIISKFDLVYDQNRQIVRDSLLLRGENKDVVVSTAPSTLPMSLRVTRCFSQKRVLFLGMYDTVHYGHWLTEGLGRFWYLALYGKTDIKVAAARNLYSVLRFMRNLIFFPKVQYWRIGLTSFGISSKDFFYTSKPIQMAEIVVPQCSIYNRCEINDLHLLVTQKIAKHLSDASAIVKDDTPVYLSRTRLKSSKNKNDRQFTGEQFVEDYCRKLGIRIVYPEKMSLREQIILFNTHNTYIGFIGSAFHSLLFRFTEKPVTCVYLGNDNDKKWNTYNMIDKLMGNKSVYLPCIEQQDTTSIDSFLGK